MADLWKTEIYDRKSKRWKDYGAPSSDFHRVYRDAMESNERGLKVRITKIPNGDMKVSMSGKDVNFSVPETPEQKMPAAETPEQKNMPGWLDHDLLQRTRQAGCKFMIPFECEYCTVKKCPVGEDDFKKLSKEIWEREHKESKE